MNQHSLDSARTHAFLCLYFFAALNLIGALGALAGVRFFEAFGLPWVLLINALIWGVLGAATHFSRSQIPLIISAAILTAMMAWTAYLNYQALGVPMPSGLLINGIVLGLLVRPFIMRLRYKMNYERYQDMSE